VKIGEKTTVTYHGVGPNGAEPTASYGAAVRFEEGSKEVAAGVTFTGPEAARRGPDVAGTLVGATRDGKGITIEVPAGRGAERGAEAKKVTVTIDDKTVLAFSNVAEGEAKMTAGQTAQVWYADDVRVAGNRIAGKVQFIGTAEEGRRNEPRPDAVGKVVAVADGGKSITIEVPVRGEEPTRMQVKIGEKTTVVYHNVGVDGAKPAEGMQARVWLSDTARKGLAAKLHLTGTVPERWTVLTGKVVAVAKDGSSFTVEQPPAVRGEGPTRTEIKLTPRTRIAFFGVGTGEAKPAEGLQAQVQLIDGSKETAAQVTFSKPGDRGRRE
jgi:hypothetical protein